ncbi:hypothetical protein C8R46DRAFT_1235667 [Mycena filopes]|nr:hypothetical protein C8R46DRAFT_1235667 [Mycena filopes]
MDDHPFFPLDLEREIFESTAEIYPETRTTLLRVARRVLVWIEPLLYRVIRAEQWGHRYDAAIPALLKKPAEFCRLAVRHLLLDAPGEKSHKLLKLCSSVTDLGLGASFQLDCTVLPTLTEMRLQRLTVNIQALGDMTHPLFSSLTHLAILVHYSATPGLIVEQIPTLTALTHLTVNFDINQDVVDSIFTSSPRLQQFMVLYLKHPVLATKYDRAKTLQGCDPRFVIALYTHYWSTWAACAEGLGDDHWARGDAFLAQKRRGEIEGALLLRSVTATVVDPS